MRLQKLDGRRLRIVDGKMTGVEEIVGPIETMKRAGFKTILTGEKCTVYVHAECLDDPELPAKIYEAREYGGQVAIVADEHSIPTTVSDVMEQLVEEIDRNLTRNMGTY